jgi:hypothetical protein
MGFLPRPRKGPKKLTGTTTFPRMLAVSIEQGRGDARHKGWIIVRSKMERTKTAYTQTSQWLRANGRWTGNASEAAVIPVLENANACARHLRRHGPQPFSYIVVAATPVQQGQLDAEREAR